MSNITETIVQLNKYDPARYNVLVPVTTMQVASTLQRLTVSEVVLDTRQDSSNKGPSKDIYFERSSSKFAITKVGGMKLAAAANISIVSTDSVRTEVCKRCIEMARETGKARVCGDCEHVYDVAVAVTVRVPEPAGGFRLLKSTKEIDCTLERAGMSSEAQYKRFLPHRTAMAESKAFMRAVRAALGLAGTYDLAELKKPFIVARIVPNLDAPEIKNAVAANYLQSMGMLFEMPAAQAPASLPAAQEAQDVPAYDDEQPGQLPWNEAPEEPDWEPAPDGIFCSECNTEIVTTPGKNGGRDWSPEDIAGYSERNFGRVLCPACQQKAKGARRR